MSLVGDKTNNLLDSLALHSFLLMPSSGSTGPVVHQCGLTGSAKSHYENKPSYLRSYIAINTWNIWIVLECNFNVKLQIGI